MSEVILKFVTRVQEEKLYVPSDKLLLEVISVYESWIGNDKEINGIGELYETGLVCLSYFAVIDKWIDEHIRIRLSELLQLCLQHNYSLIYQLINAIKPMLVKADGVNSEQLATSGRKKINSTKFGLKPRLGFEDEFGESRWREWRNDGGLRSIGLFYSILSNIKKKDVSSNLPWISPGILNIIDDTTFGPENVRLYGVLLLQRLLQTLLESSDEYQFSFQNTGLYSVYEPILTSLLYRLPPSSPPEETLSIWKVSFPAMKMLIEVETQGDQTALKLKLGMLLSENILQLTLPRIGPDHVSLSLLILGFIKDLIPIFATDCTLYLQRSIYVIGEIYLRNPFITLHMPLIHHCLDILTLLCDNCIPESVVTERYDVLACVLLTYEKCYTEGTLDSAVATKCRLLIKKLELLGCDFTGDKPKLQQRQAYDGVFA